HTRQGRQAGVDGQGAGMNALWGRRWAVVAAASGTVLIGGGAFWLSFVALADLAVRSGIDAGQAWIWPLPVEGDDRDGGDDDQPIDQQRPYPRLPRDRGRHRVRAGPAG